MNEFWKTVLLHYFVLIVLKQQSVRHTPPSHLLKKYGPQILYVLMRTTTNLTFRSSSDVRWRSGLSMFRCIFWFFTYRTPQPSKPLYVQHDSWFWHVDISKSLQTNSYIFRQWTTTCPIMKLSSRFVPVTRHTDSQFSLKRPWMQQPNYAMIADCPLKVRNGIDRYGTLLVCCIGSPLNCRMYRCNTGEQRQMFSRSSSHDGYPPENSSARVDSRNLSYSLS